MASSELPPFFFFFFFFILLWCCYLSCFAVAAAGNSSPDESVHDLLRVHGLPGGLVPKGVASHTFDEKTGLLDVRLEARCYASYDADRAFFDDVVRGNLSFGALRGVQGLAQEELFLWLPVKGILVADPGSGVILFDIGVAHKQLSRALFEEPPDCIPETHVAAAFSGDLLGRRKGIRDMGNGDQGHEEQR